LKNHEKKGQIYTFSHKEREKKGTTAAKHLSSIVAHNIRRKKMQWRFQGHAGRPCLTSEWRSVRGQKSGDVIHTMTCNEHMPITFRNWILKNKNKISKQSPIKKKSEMIGTPLNAYIYIFLSLLRTWIYFNRTQLGENQKGFWLTIFFFNKRVKKYFYWSNNLKRFKCP
jgi:hypothetical protein